EDPYTSYSYNAWSVALPSQNGYIVKDTITGADMGLDQLSDPNSPLFISEDEPATLTDAKDFFLSPNNEFFIVDTGNNRILRTDINFNLIACYKNFTGGKVVEEIKDAEGNVIESIPATTLKSPYGIFVDEDDIMYIADRDNQRIIKCGFDCEIITEYVRPETELYDSVSFYCTKVLVDAAKNVYVICPAVNKGAIMFAPSGSFMGYYGANRVEVTAEVIRNKLWRKFASEEQIAGMINITPVEYANFDVDHEGFIYTVTEVADVSTDAVKKLNPAGYNILETTTNAADISFGDQQSITYSGATTATRLTDVAVGENGIINILDYTTGRVFQYDKECSLLFIFGCDQEAQNGGFDNPNAVECYGENIYVLDGRNNDVTVYEETLFGGLVHEAVDMFNEGLYEDSLDLWREVLKRDGNYNMAYLAIGRALLNQDNYDEAMKYFKLAYNAEDYDRAFEAERQDLLRDNFTLIVIVLVLLVIAWFVVKQLQKRGIIPNNLIKRGIKWVADKIVDLVKKIISNINKKGGSK
ncbi:MAG: hypothetical protein IJX54_06195, partial [Oscillospiraceae bacterium]|nr:hypothetical protein [Oscillospiraceae bacterium]